MGLRSPVSVIPDTAPTWRAGFGVEKVACAWLPWPLRCLRDAAGLELRFNPTNSSANMLPPKVRQNSQRAITLAMAEWSGTLTVKLEGINRDFSSRGLGISGARIGAIQEALSVEAANAAEAIWRWIRDVYESTGCVAEEAQSAELKGLFEWTCSRRRDDARSSTRCSPKIACSTWMARVGRSETFERRLNRFH